MTRKAPQSSLRKPWECRAWSDRPVGRRRQAPSYFPLRVHKAVLLSLSESRQSVLSPLPLPELVASLPACTHGSPWLSWRPSAGAAFGAVSKRRGTPRQRGGEHAQEHRLWCVYIPEMDAPHRHACSPHVSRGYAAQHNSQSVSLSWVSGSSRVKTYGSVERVIFQSLTDWYFDQ